MKVDIQFYLNNALTHLQEKVWEGLTDQQKQIGLIASAAIGLLAGCFLIYRFSSCCFKAKVAEAIPAQKVEKKGAAPVESMEMEILGEEPDEQPADPFEKAEQLKDGKDDQPLILADDWEFVDETPSDLIIKEDEYRSEPKAPLIIPSLLSSGEVRKNITPGDPPSLEGITFSGGPSVMESAKRWTAAFARCFHTSESHQEIYQLLRSIREKMDPDFDAERLYVGDFVTLYNNLLNLHDALPGEEDKKEIKIYWSKSVEEELIPYLFLHEEVDVKKLLFAIIEGEKGESPFQADVMDFNHQMQFIGLDFKLMGQLKDEIDRLSPMVLNVVLSDVMSEPHVEFLKESLTEEIFEKYVKVDLVQNAFLMTGMMNVMLNLQDLQAKSKEFNLLELAPEQRNLFLKNLLNPPQG